MHYYFIINPVSGGGRGKKIWASLEETLKSRNISYKGFLLRERGQARTLAQRISCVSQPCTAVIVGGDGTIDEFLDGLARWEHLTLGCIPTGSGNDFVRGLSLERDPAKALDIILSPSHICHLKVGIVQAENHSHKFIISSGIGFDADVCNGAYRSGMKQFLNFFHIGKLVYLTTAFRLLVSMKLYPMKITLDTGEVFSFDNAFFTAVMNLPYEGGGFWFAPALRPEEENFHICVAEQMNRRRILKILPLAFSGNHVGKKGVHILPCTRAVIQTSQPLCVHTDGEILGFFDEISIEAAKDRLNVITG